MADRTINDTIHELYVSYYGARRGKVRDLATGRLLKVLGACRLCGAGITRATKAKGLRMTCVPCARKKDVYMGKVEGLKSV